MIVSPNGAQEQLEIPIGGIKEWISVRGRARRNPILLAIHGGPGSTEMPLGWIHQTGWEDHSTVMQWDQRGAGKTCRSDDPAMVKATLSLDQHGCRCWRGGAIFAVPRLGSTHAFGRTTQTEASGRTSGILNSFQ